MNRLGMAEQKDLARWADTVPARTEFPRLIRRLILETTPGLVGLGMPAGEGVSSGGWDGTIRSSAATAFIPAGLSLWELSVEKSVGVKADDDYSKRSATPDSSPLADCTYVAASLRRWTKRTEWANERTAEGRWQAVRALGLDEVDAWLEIAPVTHAWLSEELGMHPHGLRSAEGWWTSWAAQTSPSFAPGMVLSGNDEGVRDLRDRLAGAAQVTTVRGASLDEAIAFCASYAVALEEDGDPQTLARMAIVDDVATWRSLVARKGPLILVAASDAVVTEAGIAKPHQVIVPVSGFGRGDIVLAPLDAERIAQELEKSGVRAEVARLGGQLGRRSLTALRRNLAVKPELHEPNWARPSVSRAVRASLIAGDWNEGLEGDKEVLAHLSGLDYEACRDDLRPLAQTGDPLLSQLDATWALVSPSDAWLLLNGQLTRDDLDRMRENVLRVLSERNPALDLAPDQRWTAGVMGKVRRYSGQLRNGLARSLVLLAVYGDQVTFSGGVTGSSWASYQVREVLDAANGDRSGELWTSLADLLPLLAEAAPDRLMDAVRDGLAGDDPLLRRLFTDAKDGDSFSSSSAHTGLLWALERLAWSPAYFGQVVDLLARLDAVDPGGRLSNRPFESLASIFTPWHPETSVDISGRLAALDGLRARHAGTAWRLQLAMLPDWRGFHMNSVGPEFRDWKSPENPVRRADYFKIITEVVHRSMTDAGADGSRWAELLEECSNLPPADRLIMYERLESLAGAAQELDGEFRKHLWMSLRDLVAKHREFSETDWALPAEEVERLQRAADLLAVDDPLVKHRWLFADWRPDLGTGSSRRDDHEAYDAELADSRRGAVAEIEASLGLEGVQQLARQSVVPWAVGVALADAVGDRYSVTALALLADGSAGPDLEVGHAYVARRFASQGWVWMDALLRGELSAQQKARLLWAARDYPPSWVKADEAGDDVAEAFWRLFSPMGHGADFEHALYVVQRLEGVGRFAVALDTLGLYMERQDLDQSEVAKMIVSNLRGLIRAPEDPELRVLSQWDFERLFRALESQRDVLGTDEVASLEWAYLPALGHEPEVVTLHEEMATSPAFFVEIVETVYRAETHSEGEVEETTVDDAARGRAQNGYRLLSSWATVPGRQPDGTIDAPALNRWIDETMQLLRERNRLESGLRHIGEVLASAPPDPDDLWPPATVRDLLERVQEESLERGLLFEVLNRRGVTSRAPGEGGSQEASLATKYAAQATQVADRWPRSAAILRSLSDSYAGDSRREESEAEHFRRGLER